MKLPDTKKAPSAGKFNVFTLLGVSLAWGHMLDLIHIYLLPLTVLCVIVGYGSELTAKPEDKTNLEL